MATPTEVALDIVGVSKRFGSTVALEEVSLQVGEGEFLTLLGPSGSGKTTLLRLIVGFELPTSGAISLHGRDISGLSPAERSAGMVFQQYALFPHMTVRENVSYGLRMRRWSRQRQKERSQEMLDLVQLGDYADRYPRQLSGGQQQRVALARALAYDPDIILMDEPLGALDRSLRLEMEQVIRRIHRDLRATVVYVTHDQQEALALSDRIAIMRNGSLTTVGTPEELYYSPADAFVASFFANANVLPAEVVGGRDGAAEIQFGEQRLQVRSTAPSGVACRLAVRPRSLRLQGGDNDVHIAGSVEETLLFGDEREVTLRSPAHGRVLAMLGARDSAHLDVGNEVTLFAGLDDVVLVADADTAAEIPSVPAAPAEGAIDVA